MKLKQILQVAGIAALVVAVFAAGMLPGTMLALKQADPVEGVGAQSAVGYTQFLALRVLSALDVDGNANVDGTLTVDGASTLTGNITTEGTVSAEQLTSTDDATVTDALSAGSTTVGGGYGSTGCSISAAGVLQCDGAATFGSTINGAYPLLYGTTGYAVDLGTTTTVTDTETLSLTNVTTPTVGFCTLGEDSEAAEATCTVAISGVTATLKVWNADGSTAGANATTVHWLIVGQE